MFISIGKVSSILGVSVSTLRRWDEAGYLVPAYITRGGHRRYKLDTILEICGETTAQSNLVVGYASVSGHKQKKDLNTQKKQIEKFAEENGLEMGHIYSDIASGLNENRQNFMKLLHDIPIIRPRALIITYRDRLV